MLGFFSGANNFVLIKQCVIWPEWTVRASSWHGDVPESPCVDTWTTSCLVKLHQHDLLDLHTTHNWFPPHNLPPPLSHPDPMLVSLSNLLFSFLSTVLSNNIVFPLSLSLSFIPHLTLSFLCMWFVLPHPFLSLLIYILSLSLFLHSSLPPSLPLSSLSASLAGYSLQWVSIMEAGSGAAAAVGSAALGLLGSTATSSHDILDR